MLHSTGRQLEYVQSKNANYVQNILLNAIIYLFRLIREIRLNKIEKNRVEHLLKLILSVQSLFANAIKRTINCQWSSLSSINPMKINSLKIANYWKNFFYNFARDRILIKDKRLILNSTEIQNLYIYVYKYYHERENTHSFHEIDEMYLSQYEVILIFSTNDNLLEQCLTAILL